MNPGVECPSRSLTTLIGTLALRSRVACVCDFGVEVTGTFDTVGEVYATEPPGAKLPLSSIGGLRPDARGLPSPRRMDGGESRESAGRVWEIYGDPTPDPAHTASTVVYLLK